LEEVQQSSYLGNYSKKSITDAIINFGYGNHYGHPKSLVLESLMENNLAPYFCTQFEEYEYELEISFP
jgi:beta-lactamase superfamily II metal-dependent hydrolase